MRKMIRIILIIGALLICLYSQASGAELQGKTEGLEIDADQSEDLKEKVDGEQREEDLEDPIIFGKMDFRVPWFTMSPRVGYCYFMKTEIKPTVDVGERHALFVTYGFNFGGEGFSSEVAPVYIYEDSSNSFGEFHSLGLYLGVNWRWRFWNLVPSAGFGVRGAYLLGKGISYGMEVYGRVPLSLSWYFTPKTNLILELGFSYGATGVKAENLGVAALTLGHNFSVDTLIGMRFP